jgi:tetratricopeptide (TPR) repeat protein
LGSILKALGLTIWGLIGFGLLVVFIFVGYQAALKFRSSGGWAVESGAAPSASNVAAAPAAPIPGEATSIPSEPPVDVAHQLFRSAAVRHQHHLVIEYGQQLVDDGIATPEDMVSVAQSYSSIADCSNTRIWIDKANSAFRAEGRLPVRALDQIVLSCQPAQENSRPVANPAQKERTARLLQSLATRAEADRRRLPQLEAQASAATSGDPSIFLGELYYGFGDYEKAIESLNRGLAKGGVRHLDDAYVYLGLAERAVGDVDEARKIFARLKDVPGISPRVARLWMLFEETQL